MAPDRTATQAVVQHRGSDRREAPDEVIVEAPLEIRLDGVRVTTTMRTPGDDFELAVGFFLAEGLLPGAAPAAVRRLALGAAANATAGMVSVETGGLATAPTPRLTTTTSSCGWCGTDGAGDVTAAITRLEGLARIPPEVLAAVPDSVRGHQELFASTGGVHAAAAFDRHGAVLVVREDIGRHNAVDKVAGRLLLDDALPASRLGLFVSGRTSFEIVQKAWAAGFSAVVAVSAPSSLAIDAARRAGLTLGGFARSGRLNIYTDPAGTTA